MVSLYCNLLFPWKEIIKYSEVALVSLHFNCLIGWIVICEDINLETLPILQWIFACLSKTAIKKLKQNVKFVKTFFISYLAALRPLLGHWQGGSLTHSMLIHWEPYEEVKSQSLNKGISGFRAGNLPILSVTCYPTVSLSLTVYLKQLTIVLLVSFQGIIGLFH